MSNVVEINRDPYFCREVARLLRASLVKCEPGDLYFECENAERIATADLYERAAVEIEEFKRPWLPGQDELDAVKNAAWAKLKDAG